MRLLRFGRVRAGAIGDVVKASEASEGKGIRSSCYGGRTYVVMVKVVMYMIEGELRIT